LSNEDIETYKLGSDRERLAFVHGKYGKIFYNARKIPEYIYSEKYSVRLAFFIGYCVGGKITNTGEDIVIMSKGQLGSAGLCYLAKTLGYKVSISFDNRKVDLFRLRCSTKFHHASPKNIKSITNAPSIDTTEIGEQTEYVYDIETMTHHFAAGVGDMIVHNSGYGCWGADGAVSFRPGAACVTAMGRRFIMMAIERIKKEYAFFKLVYGDSVSKDTPILCRMDGKIFYRTIDDLPVEDEAYMENGKFYCTPQKGLEVWTDKGFTILKRVISHSVTKKMYRILTHTGLVDVTEDHSLLDEHSRKISPKSVKKGTQLLHNDLPKVGGIIKNPIAYGWTFYGDGSCPNAIFRWRLPKWKKRIHGINNTNLDFWKELKNV
jgi:hypothetical protein